MRTSTSDELSDRSVTPRLFRVHGRVQGVGFRWFTQSVASDLHLEGYVRNLADGSVEVLAAGSADALDRLREALRRGPAGSRVTGIDETPGSEPATSSFEIVE
jgi:acylphosphatase